MDQPTQQPRTEPTTEGAIIAVEEEKCCGQKLTQYIKDNPVPSIIGGIGVGILAAVIIKLAQSEPEPVYKTRIKALNDLGHRGIDRLAPLGSKAERLASETSDSVSDLIAKGEKELERYAKTIRQIFK